MNKISAIINGLLLGILLLSQAAAQNAEFNYNGRVNANGQPFTGTGRFKFALVDQAGTQTYYANDGITLNGQEPTTYVTTVVSSGFFSVNIGDTTIPGMAELDPSLFNSGPVYLRTWFSDGTGFEQLSPDRRIVNPGLLGLKSKQTIDIYVNAAIGNDHFSGLSASRPKRTIQAAWDAIPALVETTATIHLADGTYREQVGLDGKSAIGHAKIEVIGNNSSPLAVRITGADSGNETEAVREGGFDISNQRDLVLEGLSFDHHVNYGVRIADGAMVAITRCIFQNEPNLGIWVTRLAQADLTEIECHNTAHAPIWVDMNSIGNLNQCYIHNCQWPVAAVNSGVLDIAESRFESMDIAVHGYANALISYNTRTPFNQFKNCNIGTRVLTNSTVLNANNWCTYVNTPTKVDVALGDPVSLN